MVHILNISCLFHNTNSTVLYSEKVSERERARQRQRDRDGGWMVVCCFCNFTVAVFSTFDCCFMALASIFRRLLQTVSSLFFGLIRFLTVHIHTTLCWNCLLFVVNVSFSICIYIYYLMHVSKNLCVIYNAMSNCVSARVERMNVWEQRKDMVLV